DADDIGAGDGVEGLRQRIYVGGNQEKLFDTNFAGRDFRFPTDSCAIFHQCFQLDVRCGGGMNVPAGEQDFGREADRFGEVMSDGSQRRQEQIAEAMALKPGAPIEAVLKMLRQESFIFAQGDNAIADIARREHVQFLAQSSAGTAVVADGNHGAEVANSRCIRPRGSHLRGCESEALKSLEQSGEPGTTTNGDYAET